MNMSTTAEIWIDHRRAVITTVTDKGQTTAEVKVNNAGPQLFTEVIAAIGDAMTVLIFGPDEAKSELCRHLHLRPVVARVHVMGLSGISTKRQIADRAHVHFYA
jgi:hypothetical protein